MRIGRLLFISKEIINNGIENYKLAGYIILIIFAIPFRMCQYSHILTRNNSKLCLCA